MRPSRQPLTVAFGGAWLALAVLTPRTATGCEQTTERVVGYSVQRDEYVAEERSGADGARYLTRRLSSDDVVDHVACPPGAPCSTGDALGMRACSFRPVPLRASPEMSLEAGEDPGALEVRMAGREKPLGLLRVHGEGTVGLRSAVRTGSQTLLFLTDSSDEGGCPRTRERAVLMTDPETGPAERDVDLTDADETGTEVRLATPASPERLNALTMAARAAAAAHLDALAGCWAQQALAIISRQHRDRASALPREVRLAQSPPRRTVRAVVRQQTVAGGPRRSVPIIRVSGVRVIVGRYSAPSGRAGQ